MRKQVYLVNDGNQVFFTNDQVLFTIVFDFIACVLVKQDAVAFLNGWSNFLTIVQVTAFANCYNRTRRWLILGIVSQDNSANRLFFSLFRVKNIAIS